MEQNELDPLDWESRVASLINRSVKSCYPRSWKEDLITDRLLREFRKELRDVVVQDWRLRSGLDPIRIQWDTYKLSVPVETDRGDIAILVVRSFRDGTVSEGVGFLEAKRVYPSGTFDGIKHWEQLERMQQVTPHHHVLYYDNTLPDLERSYGARVPLFMSHHGMMKRYGTHAVVVPTNYVTALRSKERNVYRQGVSLAYQLCARYLAGFDLEYDRHALLVAKGQLDAVGGPMYLLVTFVTEPGAERPHQLEINFDRYIPLASFERG